MKKEIQDDMKPSISSGQLEWLLGRNRQAQVKKIVGKCGNDEQDGTGLDDCWANVMQRF